MSIFLFHIHIFFQILSYVMMFCHFNPKTVMCIIMLLLSFHWLTYFKLFGNLNVVIQSLKEMNFKGRFWFVGSDIEYQWAKIEVVVPAQYWTQYQYLTGIHSNSITLMLRKTILRYGLLIGLNYLYIFFQLLTDFLYWVERFGKKSSSLSHFWRIFLMLIQFVYCHTIFFQR